MATPPNPELRSAPGKAAAFGQTVGYNKKPILRADFA